MDGSSVPGTKRCTKCGEEKPATREVFLAKHGGSVLLGPCRACYGKLRPSRKKPADQLLRKGPKVNPNSARSRGVCSRCGEPYAGTGWCNTCSRAQQAAKRREKGVPQKGNTSDESYFWSRVQIGGNDECWPWLGAKKAAGYGNITIESGVVRTTIGSHRLAWEYANGRSVPTGMCICHRCDNPPCCNPKHLFLGTQADNMADKIAKGRDPRMLKPETILAIAACLARGMKHREIREELGVSESAVQRVKYFHLRKPVASAGGR